jgi:acyl-CoA thioester hydrolase
LTLLSQDASFVIASLKLDFLNEINWFGQVDIGTGILRIGNSSIVIIQMLYQHAICVASAETVVVQVHNVKKASVPLSESAKETLGRWLMLK